MQIQFISSKTKMIITMINQKEKKMRFRGSPRQMRGFWPSNAKNLPLRNFPRSEQLTSGQLKSHSKKELSSISFSPNSLIHIFFLHSLFEFKNAFYSQNSQQASCCERNCSQRFNSSSPSFDLGKCPSRTPSKSMNPTIVFLPSS